MSASESSDRDLILEGNLRALFERAWQPLPIRGGFAVEVRRSAEAALNRAQPSSTRPLTFALAAAASFLLAAFVTGVCQRSEFARERILEHHRIAVREDRGAWHGSHAAQWILGSRELEIAVPDGRELALACDSAAIAMLGPASAAIAPSGGGATVDLAYGGLTLRGFQGRVRGEFGSFECSAADLDMVCDARGSARAWLGGGRARFESRDGHRQDLARGELFDTRPGATTLAGGTSTPAGLIDLAGARRPLPLAEAPATSAAAPRAALSGSVRASGGEVIAKLRVILLREVELPRTAQPIAADFDGVNFRFEALEPGDWTVFVHADDFALAAREHVRIGDAAVSLDFVMDPGASVFGRVLAQEGGRPLANVVVVSEADVPASLLPFDFAASRDHPAALVRSDGEGRFRFEHLARRSTVLRACAPGVGASWTEAFVPGEEDIEHHIELREGGSLVGRVEREDGSPWTNAVVIAMPQRTLRDLPRLSYGFGLTDPSGGYRVADLPAGDYVAVRVELTSGSAAQTSDAARVPRTEVREVRITPPTQQRLDFLAPPRGSRLAGRVLRTDRTPFAAATVSIMPKDAPFQGSDGAPPEWRSQLCSADGVFEFTDVAPGSYEMFLGVRTPMDTVQVDTVEVGPAENVDREIIARGGELAGSIRAAIGGRAVGFAAIVVEREQPGSACEFAAKVFSDEAGRWRVPYLRDGTYRVRAYAGGDLACAGRDGVEIRGASSPPAIDFELAPGAPLTLTLRDEHSTPLSGVEVRIDDERGMRFRPARDSRTDARGRCVLEGLPPGRLRLSLEASGGRTAERWVVVEPPQALELEIELPSLVLETDRK